jgi:hypothetical protein
MVDGSFKDHIPVMLPLLKLLLQEPAPILVLGQKVVVATMFSCLGILGLSSSSALLLT